MKDKKKIGLILMYLSFGIVMAGLGANDALRGVFSNRNYYQYCNNI